MNCIFKVIASLLLGAVSVIAHSQGFKEQEHAGLEDLMGLMYSDSDSPLTLNAMLNPEDLRSKNMRDTALTTGAQNGYVSRINELKTVILSRSEHWDNLFDFSVIMKMAGNKTDELFFLPPVISVSENATELSDNANRIRISGEVITIERPGRLVTLAPNWRQYLIFDQPVEISKPPFNLLPKTVAEKRDWKLWVQQGWQAGIAQAEREMAFRARRLGNDFSGMTRYMRLVKEGKVNPPVVVTSKENVVGGGATMRINEMTVRLAMPASLNPDDNNWEALILDPRDSIRYDDELGGMRGK